MKNGDTVTIKATGIEGKVIGVWSTLDGPTQYSVRHYLKSGAKKDSWFYADDLAVGGE